MSREIPSESQIIEWFDTLSNWGRWGKDDVLGTLNLITPEKRKAAASLVSEGLTASCARPITYDTVSDAQFPVHHFMMVSGEHEMPPEFIGRYTPSPADMFLIGPHGTTVTHLDAPSHTIWRSDPSKPFTIYNGQSAKGIRKDTGATVGSIEIAGGGIVTRGVLLDLVGLFNVEWLEPGTAIFPEDLEAAEKRQGVRVEPGDLLFVRTGHVKRRNQMGPVDPPNRYAGLQAACLPWLRERDVAVLSCDTAQDVGPYQYPRIGYPIHGIGMAAIGLWLLDNSNCEELVEVCERLNRWEFLVSVGPLKWQNGTASAVNPIALF